MIVVQHHALPLLSLGDTITLLFMYQHLLKTPAGKQAEGRKGFNSCSSVEKSCLLHLRLCEVNLNLALVQVSHG